MTTDHDPLDLLTMADPARRVASFDPRSQRGREVLERVKAGERTSHRRGRPSGPRFTAIVVGVGAVVAAAAAGFINSREPTRTQSAGCFETPTLPSRSAHAVSAERESAIESCWRVWRGGKFSPTPTPTQLVGCVLEQGNVGVFPGGPEVCARLGRPLAPADVRTDPKVVALQEAFFDVYVRSECITPARARQVAERTLDDVGLARWSVGTAADAVFDEARPCATFHIDERARRVLLVPSAPD